MSPMSRVATSDRRGCNERRDQLSRPGLIDMAMKVWPRLRSTFACMVDDSRPNPTRWRTDSPYAIPPGAFERTP